MGGIGSGNRWRYGTKSTTDQFRSIDVRRWKRDGLLAPDQHFGWQWTQWGEVTASIFVSTEPHRVHIQYRHRSFGEDWQDENYPVYLDWTPCNFGGQRPWFLCPAIGCDRRAAILYGGRIFACRQCYRLVYQSQRESWDDRAARRADRIRDRLGWEGGILSGKGWRPKGMHRNTYERLTARHDGFVNLCLMGAVERFGSLNKLGIDLGDVLS